MQNTTQLYRLLPLLDKAEQLSARFTGGYSDHFFSAEEFHLALKNAIQLLKAGELDKLQELYIWFSPSYDWDDFIGSQGMELGNEIFELISDMLNSHR